MPETIRYALVMLAAGVGIPLLAAMNAQLGGRIGSPATAAVILTLVAFLGALTYRLTIASSDAFPVTAILNQPKHLFLAGLFMCFYLISVTTIAPKFGVGNAVFFVLMGQMVSAALIDQFGLFGAIARPISAMRGAGLGFMALGLFLIQKA
jgi:transporter family-2 protein